MENQPEYITAVKLREHDKRRGCPMRTYVSAGRRTYRAGQGGMPSDWHIVDDPNELLELEGIAQFEIRSFPSVAALEEHVQRQMETKRRQGYDAVRALIEGLPPEYRQTLEHNLAHASAQAAPAQPAGGSARDLSVMGGPPAKPGLGGDRDARLAREAAKGAAPPAAKRIDAEAVEIDYDAQIADLQAKIKQGGVTARTMQRYRTKLRQLELDRDLEAAPEDLAPEAE